MLLLVFLLIKMPFAAKKLDEIVAKFFMVGIIYIIKMPKTAKILDGGRYGNKKRCIP